MKKGGVKRGDFKMLNTYNTCNLYLSVQSFDTKFVYEKPRNNKMYPRLKTKLSVSPILACTKVNFDLLLEGCLNLSVDIQNNHSRRQQGGIITSEGPGFQIPLMYFSELQLLTKI